MRSSLPVTASLGSDELEDVVVVADVALATDAITLLAWAAASNDGGLQEPELRFAGSASCEVTASAQQVHGAAGFALETGLHAHYRRARSVHAWTAAVCSAVH